MHNPPKRHSTLTHNPAKRNQLPARNPPNETNHPHAICPNDINRFMRNLPKRNRRGEHPRAILSSKIRRGGACVPARTFAQRRFHTKTHALCAGNLMMDALLWGDTGGHTDTAPTISRMARVPRLPEEAPPTD